MIKISTKLSTTIKRGRMALPRFFCRVRALTARQIVYTLTLTALFAGITCFANSPSTRLDRYMSLTYAIVAAMGLQLSLKSLPTGLFLVWTAVIFWIHPMTPILAALATVIYAGGLLYLVYAEVPRNRVYNLICCYAMANVLWQVLQIMDATIGYRPIFTGNHTLVGLQTNVGETSALMAICLPAFFRRRWAWFIPVPLAGMIMAQETVGILATAAIAAVWIWDHAGRRVNARLLTITGIIAILVSGIFYVTFADPFVWESHKNSRWQTWKESVIIALEKPLTGWGYGQFCAVVPLLSTPTQLLVDDRKRLYDEVEDKKAFLATANKITGGNARAYYTAKKYPRSFYFEAHNEYVETLFAAGVAGVVLLLSGLLHLMWKGWRQADKIPFCGLAASCIAANIWFVWQIVPIAVVTVVWAGLCLREAQE